MFGIYKEAIKYILDIKEISRTKTYVTKKIYITIVMMRIIFPIVDKKFLGNLEEYINVNAEAEEGNFSGVPSRIFKAAIAYQYLCTITDKDLTLQEIYEKHPDLGLIGPGNGCLTGILEKLFGSLKTFRKHAVLHDVFGNFYTDFEEGPGYVYATSARLPSWIRARPFAGHISGLILFSKTDISCD